MKKNIFTPLLCIIVFIGALVGCARTMNSVYKGEGQGNNDVVKVEVTMDNDVIKSVVITEHHESAGISDPAIEKIPEEIVNTQSLDVDSISGATVTSNAIKEAVENAIISSGADISKYKKSNNITQGENEDTDVVVVGAGLSGVMAAVELHTNYPDLRVIVVEKQGVTGGALPFTGGAILSTDSSEHKELGLTSTTDDIVEYLADSSHSNELNDVLTKEIFKLSGETMDWFTAAGFQSKDGLTLSTVHNDKLYTDWSVDAGAGFNKFLTEYIKKNDIDVRLNTCVTDLLVVDGAVTGVNVKNEDSTYTINAKAVLLATGGFGKNKELMEQYAPDQAKGIITVSGGATGDGILFTRQFNTPITGNGTMGSLKTADNKSPVPSKFLVGTDGHRFLDETMAGYRVQRAFIEAGKEEGFFIATENEDNIKALETAVESGAAQKFNTVEELADTMGIDVSGLKDEISKVDFLSDGPYYVSRVVCRSFGTLVGIQVTDEAQVVDGEGNGIPGLYAAGELMVNNVFTYQYPGAGFGISFAANSGRFAAHNIGESLAQSK